MNPTNSFQVHAGASISLSVLMQTLAQEKARPATRRFVSFAPLSLARPAATESDDSGDAQIPVIIEAKDFARVEKALTKAGLDGAGRWEPLTDRMVSVVAPARVLKPILKLGAARACHTHLKKRKKPTLNRVAIDCGLRHPTNGKRLAVEDGTGVVIGVVDSGFDLSHPAFRDGTGALRVEALLEQPEEGQPRVYTRNQLEKAWKAGKTPGGDEDGHGTHVASIAGGSAFQGYEGIAPGATFLLVKTNFVDTDEAVKWIFEKAGDRPCVINMSLGHHWGAHDGTDAEERLHVDLTKKAGRILCVSAGNEREDALHLGGRFDPEQTQQVFFNAVHREVPLIFWHAKQDKFDLSILAPDGSEMPLPSAPGQGDRYEGNRAKVELATQNYNVSKLVQRQIQINFSLLAKSKQMHRWGVKITFKKGTTGRIDGWFGNSNHAVFDSHPLVEQARTVGLAATGDGCIAVASHVSKMEWPSGHGSMKDAQAVVGRTSYFSSMGPTRDGRWKPDISAPGQYVTAALAGGSDSEDDEDRSHKAQRLLSIEGTSMASPVVTGVVALLLQKNPKMKLSQVRDVLRRSARHDENTTHAEWSPAYGHGKIDVAKALSLV